MNKTIEELHHLLIENKITSKELILDALQKAKEVQKKCNAFVTIIANPKVSKVTNDMVSGIPFGIKDNYSTKDILSTASSNSLKDYVPFFNATAVENIINKGGIIASKTILDELAMGATGLTSATGIAKNPWDTTRIAGGSSSGSAICVSCGVYPYALGSDTGDSIRKPAAFCGVVGYKPTYGMISRYGLFPFASSMDTCGCLTRSVKDAAIVVDAMKGEDIKDMTSWDSQNMKLYESLNGVVKGKKLFYIKEIVNLDNYPNCSLMVKKHLDNFYQTLDKLRTKGIIIEEVSIDKTLLQVIPSTYTCIACAEATSNMSNLTGIIFGPRSNSNNINDLIKDYRTKGFSPLIKRRFVIGSYVLQKENQEKYFVNAQRVRRIIVDQFNELFKKYDGLILPVSSGIAPKITAAQDEIKNDEYLLLEQNLQIANFGGYPSITIPNGFIDNMPVGVNITGKCYDDITILNIAYALEILMPYKNMIAGDYRE